MKKILLFGAALMIAAVSMAQTPTVSASSVTFQYCQTTYGDVELSQLDNATWHGETFPVGTYVRTIDNARGCDSIVTVTCVRAQGAIPAVFSVASNKQVWFSKGNLQYCAVPVPGQTTTHATYSGQKLGIWRFAEHQWDYVGNSGYGNVYKNDVKCNNSSRSASYTGWIDRYPLGATGYVSGNYDYAPYGTTGWSGNSNDITNSTNEWGYFNAISNGSNVRNKWFTLSRDQWTYLLNTRNNAASKKGFATVNGVKGLIILPDNWTLPSGVSFSAALTNAAFSNNNYSGANSYKWDLMEANGAVFLPGAGDSATEAYYWTTTAYGSSYRICFKILTSNSPYVQVDDGTREQVNQCHSVRLVRNAQ